VAEEFAHETLAKAHYLVLRFTFGIKIRSSFAAAHGQSDQGIFENLLEGEKLDNTKVNRWVKT